MNYSYNYFRVISLFCLEQPTDHILAFMGRRIESISRAMFDVILSFILLLLLLLSFSSYFIYSIIHSFIN